MILRLLASDLEALGEPVRLHPVEQPEVDHLGPAAHLRGDMLGLHAEDPGGGGGVDVGLLPAEGLQQAGIFAHMGQHPQLDL